MLVLLRARGVDVLITSLTRTQMTTSSGRLSVSSQSQGDRFVSYFYQGSWVDVNHRVFEIANLFVQNINIEESYFTTVGLSASQMRGRWAPSNNCATVFDEDRVKYAEFTLTASGEIEYALLDPSDPKTSKRVEDLRRCLSEKKIRNLSIKTGVCYAMYIQDEVRRFLLMDYSVSTILNNSLEIHAPTAKSLANERMIVNGIDEYRRLVMDRSCTDIQILCGPQMPRSGSLSFMSRIEKHEKSVVYARFIDKCNGAVCFELLDPDADCTSLIMAELREHLSAGTITRLSIQRGFCYAKYGDGECYYIKVMGYAVAGEIGKFVGHKYHVIDDNDCLPDSALVEYWNLESTAKWVKLLCAAIPEKDVSAEYFRYDVPESLRCDGD